MNRFVRSLAWLLALYVCSVAAAHAQTSYPDRPVKIIVPIGPGGSYDLVGRQLADALSKRMGQAFVVENKPGAGTVVGTQAASQSEPDGYTLVVGGLSNMAFNSALYSKLGYDPRKDFVPVALIYKFGYVMVGRKDLPHGKLQDIVAAAKANPGSISVATAGVGTGQQLVAAAFMKAAGVKFLEVPYKGSAYGLGRRDKARQVVLPCDAVRHLSHLFLTLSGHFAVLRLIDSIILVGNSTGSSPGGVPCKILSTK